MLWTIVVSISNFVCRILEPFRTDYSECCCGHCLDGWQDFLEQEQARQRELYESEPRGSPYSGNCGCDRPRWNIRPCGHCACASECDDCPANKLWRAEQESWCGCWRPGDNGVLPCGHCSCGYGCFEVVRGESHAAPHKAPCVV